MPELDGTVISSAGRIKVRIAATNEATDYTLCSIKIEEGADATEIVGGIFGEISALCLQEREVIVVAMASAFAMVAQHRPASSMAYFTMGRRLPSRSSRSLGHRHTTVSIATQTLHWPRCQPSRWQRPPVASLPVASLVVLPQQGNGISSASTQTLHRPTRSSSSLDSKPAASLPAGFSVMLLF